MAESVITGLGLLARWIRTLRRSISIPPARVARLSSASGMEPRRIHFIPTRAFHRTRPDMLQGIQDYATQKTRQRWPRPCKICHSRKVKCDRGTPCTNCKRRGESHLCVPELGRVRGDPPSTSQKRRRVEPGTSQEGPALDNPSLDTSLDPHNDFAEPESEASDNELPPGLEADDQGDVKLLAPGPSRRKSRFTWGDIILPSSETSRVLVAHDRLWNSWVHQALYYVQFEKEHESFLIMRRCGKPIESTDPSWLAIYFSVLAVRLLCDVLYARHQLTCCRLRC